MGISFDKDLYIDQCELFFHFLLKKGQWSGVNQDRYLKWRNNFEQISSGRYIAARIRHLSE